MSNVAPLQREDSADAARERLRATIEERSIPEPTTGCWLWLGGLKEPSPQHYGVIKIGGKRVIAHRASYFAFVGAIPLDLHVLHRCDNPPCVNPGHLFLGTNLDNVIDKVAKGRQSKGAAHGRLVAVGDDHWTRRRPGAIAGERSPRARLSTEQVREIRVSTRPLMEEAAIYGVSFQTISDIRRGRRWRHVS